jgi:hypothetical protein
MIEKIRRPKPVFSYIPRNGDMIASTEMAMPAFHAHDDDFLFQIQHPSKSPSSDSAAKVFLERTVRRIRNGRKSAYQVPPVGMPFWRKLFRRLSKSWSVGR